MFDRETVSIAHRQVISKTVRSCFSRNSLEILLRPPRSENVWPSEILISRIISRFEKKSFYVWHTQQVGLQETCDSQKRLKANFSSSQNLNSKSEIRNSESARFANLHSPHSTIVRSRTHRTLTLFFYVERTG